MARLRYRTFVVFQPTKNMDPTPNQAKLNTLILGATGSIGYAVATNLLARHLPVTILVRNRTKADALFPSQPTLTVVEGDAQDAALLTRLATDKTHIFHGVNYPYHQWFGNMDTVTQTIIDAAAVSKATIVLPGNVYNFGIATEPIREDSLPNPISRKGKLRVEIEAMLERAANAGTCRVLNVRLPDFWGPNVLNEGVKPIFVNALTGRAMPWLVTIDIPHQAVYTPDAAEIIVRLMLRDSAKPHEIWNYGGSTLPTMRLWFGQISAITGKPLKTRVYSRFIIRLLGVFMPVLREVKEMIYLYENTVLLDDHKARAAFPDFQPTPMNQALRETLRWYSKHELKQPVQAVGESDSVLSV